MAVGTSAEAQGDRRISTDPVQMVLPDDARIQAAATIGTRTLAVWGSSRVGSDSLVRRVLDMQMFEGAISAGPPRALTSSDADPFGRLQVLAVGESFVVTWNDGRNGGSHAYMSRVTPAGTVGAEERIGQGAVAEPGMLAVETETGFRLLWSDSTEAMEIRERRVDHLGNPITPERALDSGRVLGVKRLAGRFWGTLLLLSLIHI